MTLILALSSAFWRRWQDISCTASCTKYSCCSLRDSTRAPTTCSSCSSRLWAFTSPCSLLNMWSEIIFPTVSPVCFTPSLPKFQAQGPQLLVIGGGIRYHHRFRWFRGSRGSYCAHGFGHRLKPGTNLPYGQENHDSAGGLWRFCSHCWNL